MSYHPHRYSIRRFFPLVAWLLATLFLFYDLLLRIFPNIIIEPLQQQFSLNGYQVGLFSAVFMYVYGLMQIPAGLFIERYPLRYTLAAAVLCCAFAVLLLLAIHSSYMAYFSRFLMGFGAAFAFPGCMRIITRYFSQSVWATMIGVTMTISAFAGIVCNSMLIHLSHHGSWHTLLILLAVIGGGLAVLIVSFTPLTTIQHSSVRSHKVWHSLKEVIIVSMMWRIAILCGLLYLPYAVLNDLWGQPFFEVSDHLTRLQAGYLVSAIWCGWIIGSPIVGYWVDRTNRPIMVMKRLMWLQLIVMVIIFYLHPLPFWLLFILAMLIGVGASSMALAYLLAQRYCPHHSAVATAFVNSMVSFVVCTSLPVIGHVIDLAAGIRHSKGVVAIVNYPLHSFQLGLTLLILTSIGGLVILYGFLSSDNDSQMS